jgi:parallel beta-helix repeat protein
MTERHNCCLEKAIRGDSPVRLYTSRRRKRGFRAVLVNRIAVALIFTMSTLLGAVVAESPGWGGVITYGFSFPGASGGPLSGVGGKGSFSFDESLIPASGFGAIDGQGLLWDLSFTWNGIAYDETTANTGGLTFFGGQLIGFSFGNHCSGGFGTPPGTCLVISNTNDWRVASGSGFFYAFPGVPGAFYGGQVQFGLTVQTAPYFPIDSGDFWTYQGDGHSFTRTVLPGTVTIGGQATKVFQDDNGSINYFSNDSAGIRLHRQFQPDAEIGLRSPVDLEVTFSPPIVLANATMAVGQTVVSNGTATTNKLPRVGVLTLGYSSSFTVQGFENVTVPAGSFEAVKLQGSVNVGGDVVSETLYLVKNIGVVKLIDTSEGITETAELVATNVTVPSVFVSSTAVNFGDVPSGNQSALQTVNVGNDGTADLTIGTITLGGSDPSEFSKTSDNCSGQTLVPTQQCSVSIVFQPTSTGGKNATLVIPSNDPDENPVNVTLSGTGTQPGFISVNCQNQSLQAAINSAISGDTVQVTGNCNENVLVDNNKIRVFLHGNGATLFSQDPSKPALDIRGKAIFIGGFTITGVGDGIVVQRGSNVVMDSNVIENTGGNGVVVNQLAFAVLTNNTIQHNGGDGVFVADNATAHIGFNDETESAASPNLIQGNGGFGVVVGRSSSARIIGNTISGNKDGGVMVVRKSHADIASNTIDGNSGDGVLVSDNSTVSLGEDSGSTIYDLPNSTNTNNNGFGIHCLAGGVADGRRGTLNGASGPQSFDSSCINDLSP